MWILTKYLYLTRFLVARKNINILLVTWMRITKLFSTILPKMSTHTKGYDGETKWMYFLIEDDKLFSKI